MSTAADIIQRVRSVLVDPDGVRWSDSLLLEYISEAQRTVALIKPSSYSKHETVQLSQGTVQDLPEDGQLLIDVTASMGSDGNTPSGSISQIDRTILSASVPDWRNSEASAIARHFIYDDRAPLKFEVYPPQTNPAGHVQLIYGAIPEEVTSDSDVLALPSTYDVPVRYLVLSYCYGRSTSAQDFNKSFSYEDRAYMLLTGRKRSKQEMHPNLMQERDKR
ncbi:hypothetical protein A3765_28500 [Oleiphilus sp. HI0130]|nr:hypothetical protein A3765_28785 [Oleiphilus sp. HI0130]KZZ72493.1 hypothetical protein A3765_28500 [Oleiphilus sp. HI0130]